MAGRDVAQVLEHQLRGALDFVRDALSGLTDDEYFWEPCDGCWSVRRSDGNYPPELGGLLGVADGEARPNRRPWYCEHGWVWTGPASANWADTGDRPPVTTVAWLMTHMSSCLIGYHQDVFDSGDELVDDLVPTSAGEAIAHFERGAAMLEDSLACLDDEALLKPPSSAKRLEERQGWVGLHGEPLWRMYTDLAIAHTLQHSAEVARMRHLFHHASGSMRTPPASPLTSAADSATGKEP